MRENIKDIKEAAMLASIISDHYAKGLYKAMNEGYIAMTEEIANCALDCLEKYPVGFDWEDHQEKGGECWDDEIIKFAGEWIFKKYEVKLNPNE